MAQTLPHDWLQIYLTQRQHGKDFGQIRQELNAQGLPQDTIDAMIKQIDAYELYLVEQKSLHEKGLQAIVIAVVLLSLPLLLLATKPNSKLNAFAIFYQVEPIALPFLVYGILKYLQKPQGFEHYPTMKKKSRYANDTVFEITTEPL